METKMSPVIMFRCCELQVFFNLAEKGFIFTSESLGTAEIARKKSI